MMRKAFLLAVLQVITMVAMAVPAHPKPVKVQQPDGTFVTINLHGDEWLNFYTTEDGYSVVRDQRGYFVYAELKDQQLKPTAQVAHDALQRSASEQAFLDNVKKYQAPAMKDEKSVEKMQIQQQQQIRQQHLLTRPKRQLPQIRQHRRHHPKDLTGRSLTAKRSPYCSPSIPMRMQ